MAPVTVMHASSDRVVYTDTSQKPLRTPLQKLDAGYPESPKTVWDICDHERMYWSGALSKVISESRSCGRSIFLKNAPVGRFFRQKTFTPAGFTSSSLSNRRRLLKKPFCQRGTTPRIWYTKEHLARRLLRKDSLDSPKSVRRQV